MDINTHKHLCFNYKHIVIEEIALNGLEGIGFNLLWRYVEQRISSPLTKKMIIRFWNYIVNSENITFYKLPEPHPHIDIYDRFMIVDEDIGYLKDPENLIDGPYEYSPVENEYGSCVYYKSRSLISKDNLKPLCYDAVLEEYGETLIMVASLEERWQALAPHMSISYLSSLTSVHYCILELVGKARHNGQMTVGNTNLTKIIKDPKLLFYNRKRLQKLDLIRAQHVTQVTNGKASKNLLLRLKRFNKPIILTLPKLGTIHNIAEYLRLQPDNRERTDVMLKKGLMTQQQNKRLQKTINVFNYEDRPLTSDTLNKKGKKTIIKRRYICISTKSDDESQSDEEATEEPVKCQYKVGVNLLRQAYERFLDAGRKGLTQIEMSQLLGIEFYTSRTICRIFKSKKIVREFLEDKGRQRTARYIAVAANGDLDMKYAEEKKKFLNYLDDNSVRTKRTLSEETPEVPKKKMKLDDTAEHGVGNSLITEENVTEVKVIDGFENSTNESLLNSKKGPTLRQLRFANGLLKVTREKLAVSGYQTLSNLVAKEIGDTPMDTKALKLFVQKLVTDGQIKILKLKWPGPQQKCSILFCSPTVNKNDPIIRAKYKEISLRAIYNKKMKTKKEVFESTKSLAEYSYPRYMKIQKLHEFIIDFVYFNKVKTEFPNGFTSLVHVIPELTVEFAVGNISNICINEISHLKISEDILHLKLREAPRDLFNVLLQSSSLQNSIKLNMKVLAMLGLLQLIASSNNQAVDHHSGLTGYLFYVNRCAKLIDTSGIWPRKNANIKSLEKSFVFESFEDVKNYWSTVYEISSSTTIELPGRHAKKLRPPVRKQSEVQLFDTGMRFGDEMGPCGFDSTFYMEIPRLWHTFYTRIAKTKQVPLRKKVKKIPKIDKKKKQKYVQKLKKSSIKKVIKEETDTCGKLISRRKRTSDSTIKWSTFEDTVIMMCKAAIIIMSPSSQPGSLRVRNIVAKDLLSLSDPKKCSSLCHRRANTIDSNSTLTHKKDCIINELRRRRHLIHKYEGLLKKIRIRHSTNMSKFISEARTPMMELVWIIYQITKSKSFSQRLPCVAINIEDFHKSYIISTSSANRFYNMYKTPLDEPEIATLKEAILMTTMLSFENTISVDTATKIYLFYKMHPEKNLRIALEHLRKCGAISAKDKLFNNLLHKFTYKDSIQTSYKISSLYQRRWMCRLNSEFTDGVENSLETEFPQNSVKGSADVNCIFCELQTCDVLELVSVTAPVITGASGSIIQEEQMNVIDIEMKYKLKSGTIGWKNKCNVGKFSELYKKRDYETFLETLASNAVFDNIHNQEEDDGIIISFLKAKGEKGCTFNDLQIFTGHETKDLIQSLRELESKKIIKRVGYYENRIMLLQFVKPWSMSLESKSIIPTPWMTLDGKIRYDIFFKCAGVVMNKIFENPGCSLSYISDTYEFLSTRTVQEICMYLENCECIKLNVMKTQETDLFSDDDVTPELHDFNEYDAPENILVFPLKNSLTQYVHVRKTVLDNNKMEILQEAPV